MQVLIIGKPFYNYHIEITKEFQRQGNEVDFYSETPKNHLVIRKLFGETVEKKYIARFQEKIINDCEKKSYDLVLVLVGRYLSCKVLEELKNINPKARFVLYLWDDIKRVENFELVKNYYDFHYSFDIDDCHRIDYLRFLPLFYTSAYKRNLVTKTIDVYGAFSDHSERMQIAMETYKQGKIKGFTCEFVFVPGRFGFLKNYFRNKSVEHTTSSALSFRYRPISSAENIEKVKRSKALLDIQYVSQNGLTMRSIEALGAGVKLITTNANILKYDFYRPENCLIIDRKSPNISEAFINMPYQELPDNIYNKYSLECWVNVLSNNICINYLNE